MPVYSVFAPPCLHNILLAAQLTVCNLTNGCSTADGSAEGVIKSATRLVAAVHCGPGPQSGAATLASRSCARTVITKNSYLGTRHTCETSNLSGICERPSSLICCLEGLSEDGRAPSRQPGSSEQNRIEPSHAGRCIGRPDSDMCSDVRFSLRSVAVTCVRADLSEVRHSVGSFGCTPA